MPAATFSPKRQIESGSANKEVKRLATFINGRTAGTVAAIATANATDLATAQALANQTKTTVNAILAALKAANIMD